MDHVDPTNIIVMLVGNKCDLEDKRSVKSDDALAYSQRNNMAFMETSALDSTNVDKAFEKIVNLIYDQTIKNTESTKKSEQSVVGPTKKIESTREEKIRVQKDSQSKSGCC
mmetsp:Transcript_17221/g.17140  ORF Transcript_17221/g.17140 Transcript_17221/m.17140 type:complete len:111 (+) Transcript_17221:344-676(+)